MRFAPTFSVLCLLFCLSNGAPPKEVGATSNTSKSRIKFTDQEDNFIIEELLRIPDEFARISSKKLWDHMQKKHREKWIQQTPGFNCERTHESLRKRLIQVLIHNHPHVKVKVPKSLLQRFPLLDDNKPKRATRYPYTPQETNFILEELLKLSYNLLRTSSTWEMIKTKHDAKRINKCHGFEYERTSGSLRSHLKVLKQTGRLPKELFEKLPTNPDGSSSSLTPPRETIQSQEINEDDDEWVNSILQEPDEDIELPDFF